MAIDLFGMIVSGAVSWGVGRILDIVAECGRCGRTAAEQVGNYQWNALGCRNCWHEVRSYTNACDFTLGPGGQIGQVGLALTGGWRWERDPSGGGHYPGWVFFTRQMEARDLQGRQFVITGELSDYNTGVVYTSKDFVYRPRYQSSVYGGTFALHAHDVPKSRRDSRPLAVDLRIRSIYGDVLGEERLLADLWK